MKTTTILLMATWLLATAATPIQAADRDNRNDHRGYGSYGYRNDNRDSYRGNGSYGYRNGNRDSYRGYGSYGYRNGSRDNYRGYGSYGYRNDNYRRERGGQRHIRSQIHRGELRIRSIERRLERLLGRGGYGYGYGYGYGRYDGYNRHDREIWRLRAELEQLRREIEYLQQQLYY